VTGAAPNSPTKLQFDPAKPRSGGAVSWLHLVMAVSDGRAMSSPANCTRDASITLGHAISRLGRKFFAQKQHDRTADDKPPSTFRERRTLPQSQFCRTRA